MKYDIEKIEEIVRLKPETAIIYFWGHTPNPKKMTAACFSQWYDCYFEVDGIQYHTTEQYMMASKARLFDDEEVFNEIMTADNPHDYKKLGRKIRGFEQELWDAKKYDIVVEGNKAKFSQNPDIREFLLSTGDALIAEATTGRKAVAFAPLTERLVGLVDIAVIDHLVEVTPIAIFDVDAQQRQHGVAAVVEEHLADVAIVIGVVAIVALEGAEVAPLVVVEL